MNRGNPSGLEQRFDRLVAAAGLLTFRQGAWAIGVVCAAAFIGFLAFGIDISPSRDFLADVIVSDAVPEVPQRRTHDLSPQYIWLPADLFVWDSIRAGTLPTWERLQGGGYSPLLTINGVFHPARWATALVPRSFAPTALILIGFTAALFGAYLFAAREMRFAPATALFAAFAFAFSSAFIATVAFSGTLLPTAHMPWLALWLCRAVRTRERKTFALLALGCASLAAAGHPLIAFGIAFAVGALACALALSSKSIRPLVVLAVAGAIAAALAAPVLLPPAAAADEMWTYKTQTKAGLSYQPLSFSRWRDSMIFTVVDYCEVCWLDQEAFLYYLGAGVVLLCLAAFRRPRGIVLGPAVLSCAIVFVLLAMPGPWMAPLKYLPLLSFLKPWYLIGPFAFFVAMAAAMGLETLRRSQRRGMSVAIVCLLLFTLPTYAARAVKALDPHRHQPVPEGAALAYLRRAPERVRVTGLWGQTHQANAARLTGLEDVRLSSPVLPLRYHLWWTLVDPSATKKTFPTTRITDVLSSPLVGDFNIGYVLQCRLPTHSTFITRHEPRHRDRKLSPFVREPLFPLVLRAPSLEVRRNARKVQPRAHFVSEAVAVPDRDAAVRLLSRQQSTAVIETRRALPRLGEGQVTVDYPSDSRVVLRTDSAAGGLVVLHDAFASGWSATVDGKAAEILPVNVLSRGVVVPPGRHRVEMRYVPPGLIAGAVLSLIALILLGSWTLRAHPGVDAGQPLPQTD